MTVNVHPSANAILAGSLRIVEEDKPLFLDSIERAARYAMQDGVSHVDLYLADRGANGWLQYSMYVRRTNDANAFYLACIQRAPGAPIEFHS